MIVGSMCVPNIKVNSNVQMLRRQRTRSAFLFVSSLRGGMNGFITMYIDAYHQARHDILHQTHTVIRSFCSTHRRIFGMNIVILIRLVLNTNN